jgi:hypothetical protein
MSEEKSKLVKYIEAVESALDAVNQARSELGASAATLPKNPPFGHRNKAADGEVCSRCGRDAYGHSAGTWLCKYHLTLSRKKLKATEQQG